MAAEAAARAQARAGGPGRAQRTGFGWRLISPLFAGVMLNPINSTMIAVALVPIGRSFGAGVASTAWLVAGLYLACAIAQPVAGQLADILGARRVFLGGLVLVGAAGLAGALVPSLAALVVIRVLIGIGTSAAYPAALAMARAQSVRLGTETPGGVLGSLSLSGVVSAALGPPAGGVLVALFGWRSIFLVNLPLAAIAIVAAMLWLPADEPRRAGGTATTRKLDSLGIALFAATIVLLLLFLMRLQSPQWGLLGATVAAAAALAWWELRAARPFLDLRMLAANRPLVSTYARYVVTFFIIYGVLYGFPQWMEQARGMSASTAGLLLVPMFVVAAICNQLGARRRRVRGPLLIGTAAMVAGAVALTFASTTAGIALLAGAGALFGIANGFNVVANQSALYAQAPGEHMGTASGLFRTAQYTGSIFSVSVLGIVYGQRASDHGLHLLAIAFAALSALLLAGTIADRTISSASGMRHGRADTPAGHRQASSARTSRSSADPASRLSTERSTS